MPFERWRATVGTPICRGASAPADSGTRDTTADVAEARLTARAGRLTVARLPYRLRSFTPRRMPTINVPSDGDAARVPHNATWASAGGETAGIAAHQSLALG